MALSACSGGLSLTGDAAPGLSGFGTGDVAAQSGDGSVVVTVDQLDALIQRVVASAPEGDTTAVELEAQPQLLTLLLITALVEDALLEDFGVSVSKDAVDAQMQLLFEQNGGEQAFLDAIGAQGVPVELVVEQERQGLLALAIGDALLAANPVTDDEVAAAAAQQIGGDQVQASHILLDTEEEALAALARVEAGENFAAVAAELSTGPSGPNGGDLGLSPRGTFVPEFEAAIWDGPAPVGVPLGPVQTQFGWHIILVQEFVLAGADVEPTPELREQVEAQRAAELRGAWFSQLISDSDPQVATRFGTWSRTQQQIVPFGTDPDAAAGS